MVCFDATAWMIIIHLTNSWLTETYHAIMNHYTVVLQLSPTHDEHLSQDIQELRDLLDGGGDLHGNLRSYLAARPASSIHSLFYNALVAAQDTNISLSPTGIVKEVRPRKRLCWR